MHPRIFLGSVRATFVRYGWVAAVKLAFESLLNTVIFFDCLHIIVLERSALKPLKADALQRFSSKIATMEELEQLGRDPRWEIDKVKLGFASMGDTCILSFVDGKPAGYTWAHTLGRPELIPGLTISVPPTFIYNFAALTLPEFRGVGLQPYRHHSVLGQERWKDRGALLGYVRATNFASQSGQAKSGYHPIGKIWLLGTRKRFVALFSRSLRDLGIGRIASAGA
jgi:hypothetical protein